jgi:alkylation response protein AidB-like acyl-CoA dehydrogenase
MASVTALAGIAEKDRKMVQAVTEMIGTEPAATGAIKSLFWSRLREDLLFPSPPADPDEQASCDALLKRLDAYLESEHPAVLIDRQEEIPRWVVDRLFELGVLGMTIPREYGGGGLSVTSYNRVLERIGRTCSSTAVLVSAHLSIGCKAIALFGTAEQKQRWLPQLATHWLSAFCLSEPDVGCDAAGQRTLCIPSVDGSHFIVNGEKKWSTSGALAQVLTVMARQTTTDASGKPKDGVTALICTPDMPGVEVFEKNRSKCGIRGTWQARVRFTNVCVPRENLLYQEGKGLKVALTCLDYGRCTLAAGILGGARRAREQAAKWARTRYQFNRPLADFELVQAALARMAALTYAMDAVLYQTTHMLDRHDPDVMLETAACKVFCSEMGWHCVNDAIAVMGGEGYMAENEIERIFRDARIYLIVEGTNEVMRSFLFGYGGKQVAEEMLGIRLSLGWDSTHPFWSNVVRLARAGSDGRALRLAAELYLGFSGPKPPAPRVAPALRGPGRRLAQLIGAHAHAFKLAALRYGEGIVARQLVQARLAESAMWLHAWACTLSKLDSERRDGAEGALADAAGRYFMALAEDEIRRSLAGVLRNADEAMRTAAEAELRFIDTLPDGRFVLPESSPVARGLGRIPARDALPSFPGAPPSARPKDYAVHP